MKTIIKVNERFINKLGIGGLSIKPRSSSFILRIFDYFTKQNYSSFFTVFVFLRTLYSPNIELTKERAFEILAHEYFHLVQSMNIKWWSLKYIFSSKARARYELEAMMFEHFMIYVRDLRYRSNKELIIDHIFKNYMIKKKHRDYISYTYDIIDSKLSGVKEEAWNNLQDTYSIMRQVMKDYPSIFLGK